MAIESEAMMTTWRWSLAMVGLLAGGAMLPAAETRPNIVLLLADDLGYGDLACYGAPDVQSPHLDRLAAEGVRFTQHYSNGPECSPTRTALMTGRYQQRAGGLECAIGTGNVGRYDDAIRLASQGELGLPAEFAVIPSRLKDSGYATVLLGKWHLGYEPKFRPLRHGWDRWFGIISGNADYFHHTEDAGDPVLYENDEPTMRDGYLTTLLADEAVAYLAAPPAEPFLLYVPFTTPHTPYQGPDDYTSQPIPQDRFNAGDRADHVKLVESLDVETGRILAAIDRAGLRDSTLVIFASDNGAIRAGRNAPCSGYKGTTMEGGIRVPLIVRWPGKLAAGTESHQTCLTMDLTASILRVAGATPRPGRPLDGIDILEHVQQGRADVPRTLFWRGRRGERTWKAVRDGDLKLVQSIEGSRQEEWLFDLSSDVAEQHNLLASRAEQAAELRAKLAAWEAEVRAER